ncbi:MAG: KH domain-containing protein [Actinomycetota bacterium]|nr:KH domain-containing protein [Actinomycetota bacterium]
MAAQRGGRRRAAQQDVVRDALVAALSEALDVDADRLSLSVTLDDAPVPEDRLPLDLSVRVEDTSDGSDADEPDDVEEEQDEQRAPEPRSAGRRGEARTARAPSEASSAPVSAEELDEEAEAAADLLEGLLDAMDLPGDLRISVQEAHAEVEVVGLEEGVLIGRRGQTLDAVQELVRTAMQRRFERRSRVLVDVDGYRARRLEKLLERADEAVEEVLDTGEPQRLEPMDSIERRLVHQRVAETAGVVSTSHGREPSRRIVIERE